MLISPIPRHYGAKLAVPVADWLRDAFLRAVYPGARERLAEGQSAGKRTRPAAARRTAGAVPRLKPLAPLLPLLTGSLSGSLDGTESGWRQERLAAKAVGGTPERKRKGQSAREQARAGENLIATACRECGRALPTAGRRRVFCNLRCAATNRAAIMLSPDQARLRAAIFDRGLALTDVANACGVTKAAVGQWFNKGPNGRSIPDRHMTTIRRLLAEPNATTRRSKNSLG
jgi:hypothetical protein